ncbi:NADPH:quinone reductase-like Zn-dependent oxidoreductase [Actinoplanes lutulentus]|uniref:NADPH:quinone reductase-like Zn-dependent oxidoreductase n=1 Tax=Actinoplanes lutulentus TaxID=1287878 RepID=A0A327Z4K0_9ACTN|nr:NADP-dependent oxidoreductase [Actinoplanes lutulentus]MBB2948813.1 NADPH:quinone reductase-like Zn-dependent oxidoreductase [Actinoplanes lutulentus]RAK29725.1 NADPH:quinone reductase-like Zn-dependent oxidoreductase [Actinoplanes lutulentus]
MFAVRFEEFGDPRVLALGTAPAPRPEPGQIRVRVRAAGVSPADAALRSGRTPMSARLTLPHIPGVDAAGVVDEIGDGVGGVAAGDEVFGVVDLAKLGGASAEFAVLHLWADKPAGMPWEQAGAAGSSVETATRALDLLDLEPGMTLLIDGAAGGVGSVAVQLAVARGVRVVGTARAANHDFLARLGAAPITYGPGLAGRVTGRVDRALDVAGAGSVPELIGLTGDPGAVLTLADFTARELGVRLSMGQLAGEPDGGHGLAVAADLFTRGRFTVPIDAAFPLAKAADAHELAEQGSRRGKIVLTVDSVRRARTGSRL